MQQKRVENSKLSAEQRLRLNLDLSNQVGNNNKIGTRLELGMHYC